MERIQNKITELEQLEANNGELIKEIDNRIDNAAKELEAIQSKNNTTLSISEKVDLKTKETEAITKINTLRATKEDIQKEFKDQKKKLIMELSELREFFTKEENEFLYRKTSLAKVGGFPWNMIEGENCEVHIASNGKKVSGTILVHQTSTHVYKDAGTVERTEDNMEVRLDEKVTNAEETRALGIDVGDFVSFDPRTIITETGFIKSRFLDDKVSAAILLDLLRKYKEENIQLPYTTHFMFSCFEEVGHGANSSIPEETVEYLAVDMGAMGDDQQTDEYTVSICVKDASGPYHYEFRQHLVKLANEKEIPYKLDIYPYYGSDASAAMSAGAEVKHALLGAGIESSHSYERTHLDSVEATHRMVDAYLQSDLVK